jgi:putative cell wall-binding protein
MRPKLILILVIAVVFKSIPMAVAESDEVIIVGNVAFADL